jgi:hypothetical protein
MRNKLLKIFFLSLVTSFFYSCEKNDKVIDITNYSSPYITLNEFTPDNVNTYKIDVTSEMSPTDSVTISLSVKVLSSSKLSSILYEINSDNFSEDLTGKLSYSEAANPDNSAETIYSSVITFKIQRKDVGTYQTTLYGFDANNTQSNIIIKNLSIEKYNNLPEIFDISAPDTITVGTNTQLFTLSVSVSDPDGLSDISKVFFNSYKPDGDGATNNPFYLYDDGDSDGQSGDEESGDGIYSRIIQISPSNAKGTYRFEFQAIDKSNGSSNILIHYLVVN